MDYEGTSAPVRLDYSTGRPTRLGYDKLEPCEEDKDEEALCESILRHVVSLNGGRCRNVSNNSLVKTVSLAEAREASAAEVLRLERPCSLILRWVPVATPSYTGIR